MELRKTFRFEASHVLPKHPGKCSRLHGHSWVLHVSVQGQIDLETGFVQDYADISKVVKPLIDSLDHRHLGSWTDLFYKPMQDKHRDMMVPGLPSDFYPTSENLLCWLALQLTELDVYQVEGGESRRQIRPQLGQIIEHESYERVRLLSWWSKLQLEETCTSMATLTRLEFNGRTPTFNK